jgi:hypothetical protein
MKSEPMPAWLRRSLEERGVISSEGLTRRAKIVRCRACRMPVMAGFDSARAALDAYCDLTEVSALGEAMALVAGRKTYELHSGSRLELERRDQFSIAGHPAGRQGSPPVLVQHVCGESVPRAWADDRPTPAPAPRQAEPVGLPF